jgi:D-alanyl-D-alanine carboxypeptidase
MRQVHTKFLSSWKLLSALIAGMLLAGSAAYVVLVIRPNMPDLGAIFGAGRGATSSASSTADLRPLEVEVIQPKRTVANPITEITVITNKPVTFGEKTFLSSELAGTEDGRLYYVVEVDGILQMGRDFKLEMSDEQGEKFEQAIEITSRPVGFPAGVSVIKGWPDSEYILDANKLDVQISKFKRLREDYEPADLVNLNKKHGIYTLNNAMLRADAAAALASMLSALKRDTGVADVTVVSGYRSYETQVTTYAGWVSSLGQTKADEISARPGHSDHQLGTTFDLTTVSMGYKLSEEFTTSPAGQWLKEHAGEFGFRQYSNPLYAPEPWQFRYFGALPGTSSSASTVQ